MGLRAWVGVRVHGVTRTSTGIWRRTHKEHDMNDANFGVWYRGGPIAWFLIDEDASDFIRCQPRPELYEIRQL